MQESGNGLPFDCSCVAIFQYVSLPRKTYKMYFKRVFFWFRLILKHQRREINAFAGQRSNALNIKCMYRFRLLAFLYIARVNY